MLTGQAQHFLRHPRHRRHHLASPFILNTAPHLNNTFTHTAPVLKSSLAFLRTEIFFVVNPTEPGSDNDHTVFVYHQESYVIQYATSSGPTLIPSDYVYFVPNTTATCPSQVASTHGGYLDVQLRTTIQLPVGHYVLCLRDAGTRGAGTMHTHITAVSSYRSPSSPPLPEYRSPSSPPLPESGQSDSLANRSSSNIEGSSNNIGAIAGGTGRSD